MKKYIYYIYKIYTRCPTEGKVIRNYVVICKFVLRYTLPEYIGDIAAEMSDDRNKLVDCEKFRGGRTEKKQLDYKIRHGKRLL